MTLFFADALTGYINSCNTGETFAQSTNSERKLLAPSSENEGKKRSLCHHSFGIKNFVFELKWDIADAKPFRHKLTGKMNRQKKAFRLIYLPFYLVNQIERIVSET